MSAASRRLASPTVDILVRSPLWLKQPKARKTVRDAIRAAAARVSTPLSTFPGEVAIVLADDSAIRALNRDWRGIDKPTNVLSFPAKSANSGATPAPLGDIVVAYETLAAECKSEGKTFLHHLTHLTVHGYLHLVGYDHQNDAHAGEMERLESTILVGLGLPDPYRAHDMQLS